MKSAKEMLEELGYKKVISNRFFFTYEKSDGDRDIVLMFTTNPVIAIVPYFYYTKDERTEDKELDSKEREAVNKQLEELR